MASQDTSPDVNTMLGFACAFIVLSVIIVVFNKLVFPLYEGACRMITYLIALVFFFIAILLFIIRAGLLQNPLPNLVPEGLATAWDLAKRLPGQASAAGIP